MKEITAYNAGWVSSKDETILTEKFSKIFLFFVINTICEDLSSSSKSIHADYHWDNKVWKTDELKDALYAVAHLKNEGSTKNLSISTDVNQMHEALVAVNLNGNFHTSRDVEKICIYKPSRYSEFVAICYHIRNALAHGRFSIYGTTDTDRVYVMEDGKHSDKSDWEVRSRIILRESTLWTWRDMIKQGPESLTAIREQNHQRKLVEVTDYISQNTKATKRMIAQTLHLKERELNLLMKELKDLNRIRYDVSRKSWMIAVQ